MTTVMPPEGDAPVAAPPFDTTEAPPPPVAGGPQPVVPILNLPAAADDSPAAIADEPPFEPPPPPDRTRFRGPEPFEGDRTPPGVPGHRSSYLEYLPGIYQENDFLARFLLIFESILSPVNRTVENIHHYFDPHVTPPEVVDWLGSWLGLLLDERWPEERRRELISSAVDLYQWRGTKHGLSEFLRLYTGVEPEIVEPSLREVTNSRARAFRFTVRMRVPRGAGLSRALIESIIDAEKPAFAACTLEITEI
jgi:phage tail-like protein